MSGVKKVVSSSSGYAAAGDYSVGSLGLLPEDPRSAAFCQGRPILQKMLAFQITTIVGLAT
ncbi:MAG: hypothetical protein V1857_06485 [archaeon]